MHDPSSAPPLTRPHTFIAPPCWQHDGAASSAIDDLNGSRSMQALAVWATAIAAIIPRRTRGAGVLALATLLSRAHGFALKRLEREFRRVFAERESIRRGIQFAIARWDRTLDEVVQDIVDADTAYERAQHAFDERLTALASTVDDLATDVERALRLTDLIATPDAEDATT